MLIEFSVSNFRSFRNRQTFSMVAAPRLSKTQNKFKPDVDEKKLPQLLKVAAIYGPNASGKSSLIEALGIARSIIYADLRDKDPIRVSPFKFDPELRSQPSKFEYHFIKDRMRYQFILEASSSRIHKEVLYHYPKGQERLLYQREFNGEHDHYEFGIDLEGDLLVHRAWQKLTGPATLFLAQASNNSSDELTQLKGPFDWFLAFHTFRCEDMSNWSNATRLLGQMENSIFKGISEFLTEIDVPITKIKVDQLDHTSHEKFRKSSESRRELFHNLFTNGDEIKTTLTHTTALGEAEFDFSEESSGTKNLIGFLLPWSILGKATEVLAMDELDTSLHPKIVETLVEQHVNTTNAQLIFTTHDTHLMNSKLLRRDQFWITERDMNGATQLYSIHDFIGRESEDIEKRYFEGRYRGLPLVTK